MAKESNLNIRELIKFNRVVAFSKMNKKPLALMIVRYLKMFIIIIKL